MTKTKNKNSRASSQKGISVHTHSWILALIIILIIVAVVVVIVCFVKPQSSTSLPSDSETSEQSSNSSTSNVPPIDDSSDAPEAPEKPTQYEGEDPNNLEELTGIITYKGVENGILTVMTMINQYLYQSGTCTITLIGRSTRGYYTVSSVAHGDATASYCEDFDIPTSGLTPDTYDIEIKLTSDGKTGTIHDEVTL